MKLTALALFFSCLFATTHFTSMKCRDTKYLQTITVTFPGELPMVLVEGQRVKCHCGKQPVQIHVLNGIVFASCEEHKVS